MEQFNVTGMSCAACSARVEKAVKSVPGVTGCSVSLLTNSMGVEGTAEDAAIIRAVEQAGYGASPKKAAAAASTSAELDALADHETPKLKRRLIASLGFLLVLMYFSMGHMMWGWPLPHWFDGNHVAMGLVQLLLAGIVMVINQKFFINGFKGLIHGAPNMDTLVALGSMASFVWSTYALFAMTRAQVDGNDELVMHYMMEFYFESAAMILTLITVGKMLEARSKGKTTDALKSLMKLAPKTATLVRDGAEVTAAIADVQKGDVFVVRPGENIPVDGVVLEETGLLPEAELTGDTVSPAAEMELDGVQQLDETTYYAPQDGGRITLTIAQPVADCETAFVVQGMQYTATSPLDAMSEEELSAMSAHDRRNLQKQYAHFWRKDSVYLRLLSNIGEGRIEYNRPNSQYYCGRHDFVYNFGTSDEPLQQITIVLPFAGYYQFDRLAVECQKLDTVAARAENLGAENLQNVTLGTNSLGGKITTTRSSVLVVQLPYSTGWSVTVDGTPAQVLRADTAFLGVALEPGSHTVAFTYKTPGLTAGAALSAAGVVLLAAIWAVPALRKKSKKRRK